MIVTLVLGGSSPVSGDAALWRLAGGSVQGPLEITARLLGEGAPMDPVTIRLPSLWVPEAAASFNAPVAAAIKNALRAGLQLDPRAAHLDRWGRVLGDLLSSDGSSLAEQLLASGSAAVDPHPDGPVDLSRWLAVEGEARRRRRGLWRNEANVRVPADPPPAVGRFVIAVGRVQRVTDGPEGWYLDFGEDWRRDLSLRIARRGRQGVERRLGLPLLSLPGRVVSVRGLTEPGAGVLIVLRHPDQLTLIEERTPFPSTLTQSP